MGVLLFLPGLVALQRREAALVIGLGVACHWIDPIVVMLRGWLAGGAAMLCGAG